MPTMMEKAKTLFWQKCSPHSCYVGLSCFLLLSCNLGSAVIAPFFPFLAPDFGVDRTGVALVMSSFSASQILAALLSGYLASRCGRIPVLVFGALIVALGNLTFGFVPNLISSPSARLVLFCLSRGAQGAGSSFATTVLLAMLTDATPQESRGQVM
jgi:MFS family permease